VPDFDAETKFPYGSMTSMRGGALGHNLIHRNCGEVDKPAGQWVCVKIKHAYVFLWKSITWHTVRGLAHIVFHNLCEKLRESGWPRAMAAGHRRFTLSRAGCSKIAQVKFIL
jgi:hypothetical protein